MPAKKLRRVSGLPEHLLTVCLNNDVYTVKDVIGRTSVDLLALLDVTFEDVLLLLAIVCADVAPQSDTALELWKAEKIFLPTTLQDLDYHLKGGITAGSITELVGPPGVGKTQFCHMMSVATTFTKQQGGLDGGVIFIDTESAFSPERIIEIAREKYNCNDEAALVACAENIFVCPVSNSEELFVVLQSLEELIIERGAKCVIIDSIAAIARREFDNKSLPQRQSSLGKQASILKNLAESFGIPIIVTNQVTTTRNAPSGFNFNPIAEKSKQNNTIAALGTAWAHCVNTRLILEHGHNEDESKKISIAKSPISPVCSFPYFISDKGLERTNEESIRSVANYWDHSIETKKVDASRST